MDLKVNSAAQFLLFVAGESLWPVIVQYNSKTPQLCSVYRVEKTSVSECSGARLLYNGKVGSYSKQ